MPWKFFGAFEITPLWGDQAEDDPTILLSLPFALFGMILCFWSVPIWMTANLNRSLLDIVEEPSPIINTLLTSFLISSLFGIFVSTMIIVLIVKFSILYKEVKLKEEWIIFQDSVFQSLQFEHEEQNDRTLYNKSLMLITGDLIIIFFLGIIAGMSYSFILYIPMYLIFIFLSLILINFTNLSISVTLSMILSWILVSRLLIIRKLTKKDLDKQFLDPHAEYDITDRTAQILASNEPPILCPGCRSYISANSRICRICGEEITR
ncbi:MAG: hypothetical protein ACXAD7_18710 [Candidatus Kariarchaeaceae archaeon]